MSVRRSFFFIGLISPLSNLGSSLLRSGFRTGNRKNVSTGKISFLRRLGPDVADEDLDELADIVLGILDLVGGVIRGRTRLQKIMFLLKYEHGLNIPADFKPYKYGPYSRDLDLALRYLEEKGYIEQVEVEASDDPESKPNKVMVEYVCDIPLLSDPDISADRGLH